MAKLFPKTMLMVLSAFEPKKQYSIKDLLEILPELKYKGLEYNLQHYHNNHLLKREKEKTITWNIENKPEVRTSKYYRYSITNRGISKREYLKMNKDT